MLNAIPTDNFYKFCAILGLFLTIFNGYYNFEMLSKSSNDLIILEGEMKKNGYDQDIHIEKLKKLNSELKEVVDLKTIKIKQGDSIVKILERENFNKKRYDFLVSIFERNDIQIRAKTRYIDSLNTVIEKEKRELEFKSIDNETKDKQIKSEELKSNSYSNFLDYGAIIGFFLAVYGFYNWIRIQKKIDQNLQNSN